MTKTTSVDRLIKFALDAAEYFERRDSHNEDSAFWANVVNADTMREIAATLETLSKRTTPEDSPS